MTKEEIDAVIIDKGDIQNINKKIGESLCFLINEKHIIPDLKINNETFKTYYSFDKEELYKDDIELSDLYKLFLNGWIIENEKVILYL